MNFFRCYSYGYSKEKQHPQLPCRFGERRKIRGIIMRVTIVAFFFFTTIVNASAHAQSFSLSLSNAPFKEVLKEIKKQTGYELWYNNKHLEHTHAVTLTIRNASLKEILDKCFEGQPLTYQIKDKTILVQPKPETLKEKVVAFFKNLLVSGIVTDEKGKPLPGVNIRSNNAKPAITDQDGKFTIEVLSENAVLEFSYVGFMSTQIPVNGKSFVSVVLKEALGQLDQVQIIGYGTTTKRLSTGNIATLKSEVIAEQPIANPLQALSGRLSGVQVIQTSGLPGAGITVKIRGTNSLRPNANDPLYVVDGVPFSASPIEAFGTSDIGSGSPLNMINPSDIQSIDVLKDADATAIYGSRASNGVVLITTKKGSAGKPKLDVNVKAGFSELPRWLSMLTTDQYLQVRRDAFANSGLTPTVGNAPDLTKWDQHLDDNWQKWYLGNTAKMQDASASFNGGTDLFQYLLSGNYHHETTIQAGTTAYNRGNLHLSTGYTSRDKKLNVEANIFYTSDFKNLKNQAGLTLTNIIFSVPNYPIYDANGRFNWEAGQTNFVAQNSSYTKTSTDNLNGSLSIKYNLTKGLDFKTGLGYNKTASDQVGVYPSTYYDPNTSPKGNSVFGNQASKTYLFEPQFTYSLNIGKSTLSLLGGATFQSVKTNGLRLNVGNYSSDLLLENSAYGTVNYSQSILSAYKYLSFYGRGTYNWDNRYIVNVNLRRDGSSRFGSNHQFGNFGSVAGAWLFANESFVKDNVPWISSGKLRASYGTTGNDAISDYGYLSLYSGGQVYGSTNVIMPSQLGNPDYRWEVNKKLETAFEFGLFDDRILFSAAWYRNRSGNQLVGFALPRTTGFSSYQANLPAVVENKGWEYELSVSPVKTKDFNWTASANVTIARNKLVSYPGIETSSYAGTYIIGQPLNNIQLLHLTGINPQTGLAQFQDLDHNGIVYQSSYNNQGGDYINAGSTDPKWFGGLNNSFTYKAFQLDVFIQYTKQLGYNLKKYYFGSMVNTVSQNLNYWKKPGDVFSIPKPVADYGDYSGMDYSYSSDAILSDASFLKVKNVSLSYNFSTSLCSKLKIHSLKVYAQGQNLFTLSPFKGYDPEYASNFYLNIPALRTITAGIQCSL